MGGIFGGGKAIKPPKSAPPLPTPQVGEDVGEQARRKAPRGRRATFLTGDLIPVFDENKKKSTLGGSR